MPFLASRVILGAGGWDYRAPGLRFTLSPRAHFITRPVHNDAQYSRPLFHTKDEGHAPDGFHRLHVAASESLCSEIGNVLRFGTTALVLRLFERGVKLGAEMALASPVNALQCFATRPGFAAKGAGETDRRLTATDIQRYYLAAVEAHFERLRLPAWAAEVCRLWRQTLDQMDGMAPGLDLTIDWAIKQRIFEQQLARHGFSWKTLRAWNQVLRALRRSWVFLEIPSRFTLEIAYESPELAIERLRLSPFLVRHGLQWDDLTRLAVVRKEVFALDAKFGALASGGIFNTLDAAGVLRHRVGNLDAESAVHHPPQDTRARIRGEVVSRLSREGKKYGAEWTVIYDHDARKQLDLLNPLETDERWIDTPATPERPQPPLFA
jgi:proteasome accessory factor A